jgi:mitochondrial fission protein ELM1
MSDEEEEQYLVARRKPVAIFKDIKQIHDRFKEYHNQLARARFSA